MNDTIDDFDLVARCQAGDEAARALFYDRFGPMILNRARRLGPRGKDPEDVAHEVFMEVFYGRSRFRGEGGVGLTSWLHRIVASKARPRRLLDRLSDLFSDAGADVSQQPRFDDPLVAAAVAAALSELSFEQREALVLCDVEDRPAREAAEMVGVPEGTIRGRLRLGRAALAKKLARRGLSGESMEATP